MAYIGTSPSNGVRRVHTYTATASQTTFSGASSEGVTLSYADTNYLDVYQNGILLGSADYTATSGTSVVLTQAASASDLVVIVVYDVFSVADTVSKANGGTFDADVTMANNLLVGTSDTTPFDNTTQDDGVVISPNGWIAAARDSQVPAIFNRTGSDGGIIQLRKNGTSIGLIGVANTDQLTIGTSDGSQMGLRFDGDLEHILPADSSGGKKDALADLGSSTARWQDLYLSGGVYLGGTGSANKLDDYETGTFTFTIGFSTADPTAGQSSYTGYYVKIGQLCTMYGVGSNINVTGGSGDIRIRGLPFTAIADGISSQSRYSGVSGSGRLTVASSCVSIIADMQDNVDYGRLIEIISGAGNDVINAANCVDGSSDITFTLTVPVA